MMRNKLIDFEAVLLAVLHGAMALTAASHESATSTSRRILALATAIGCVETSGSTGERESSRALGRVAAADYAAEVRVEDAV